MTINRSSISGMQQIQQLNVGREADPFPRVPQQRDRPRRPDERRLGHRTRQRRIRFPVCQTGDRPISLYSLNFINVKSELNLSHTVNWNFQLFHIQ